MKPLWRVAVLIAGLAVILAGAVMLVTPGPGLAVMLLGLTILASEFRWARYWLVTGKRRTLAAARRLKQRARRRPGARRPAAGPADDRPEVSPERGEERHDGEETASPVPASKPATRAGEGDPR